MCRAVWRDRISFPLRSIRSDCLSPDLMWEYGINVAERSEDREASGGQIMKKKSMKYIGVVLVAGLMMAALTACGGAGGKGMYAYEEAASDTAAYDTGGGFYASEAKAEYAEEAVGEEGSAGPEVSEPVASDRKLIKNVTLSVETEQFDKLLPSIEQQVTALGGYIEEMSSFSRGNEYSKDYQGTKYLRYATMTVRIPRQNLEAFLQDVGEQTNVKSRSENVTDVTLQYVDLESHKKALLTEQDRLLELMEQAESVEDIIAIEGRLSEVRYQIESMEAQLRTYDNQIDYSTAYLNVDEVEHYSPSEGASTGERIRSGFRESVEGVGLGIREGAIWFVINIPYLFIWVVLIAVVIVILRLLLKIRTKRAAKRSYHTKDPYAPYVPAPTVSSKYPCEDPENDHKGTE